jgi:hypothetical protein
LQIGWPPEQFRSVLGQFARGLALRSGVQVINERRLTNVRLAVEKSATALAADLMQ